MLFLDDADVRHIFEDKGELKRIVKVTLTHTLHFFFVSQYLFGNFTFE